jgi:hypothetical protein
MAGLVATRVVTGADVELRLRELGIEETILRRAVGAGDSAAGTCTENDPFTLGGLLRWGRSVRSLRDDLRPLGWTKSDFNGLPTVVHPEGKLAIAIARGNESTGDASADPSTKYARGPASQDRVEQNAQLALFDVVTSLKPVPTFVPPPAPGTPTYFLLHYPKQDRVEFELVLPSGLDESGRFSTFVERLMFEPYTRDQVTGAGIKGVEEPLQVDVPVKRR